MTRQMLEEMHQRAFSVAAATPAPILREMQKQIGLQVATATSFREAKTALQALSLS